MNDARSPAPSRAFGLAPVALAVVLPRDAEGVRLLASTSAESEAVRLVDDGSLAPDVPHDGEFWAVLVPTGARFDLRLTGTLDGTPVAYTEKVDLGGVVADGLYPVTLLAARSGSGWTFRRAWGDVTEAAPAAPSTEATAADALAAWGLSPGVVYLAWGAFALALVVGTVLRGAVLSARAERDGARATGA